MQDVEFVGLEAAMRSSMLLLAMVLGISCAASLSYADDLGDCLQGQERYQTYLPNLQQARAQCDARSEQIRADPTLSEEDRELQLQTRCPMEEAVCGDIRPEEGHAGCESYLQYGGGSESDYAAATQANAILKALYDECTAQ